MKTILYTFLTLLVTVNLIGQTCSPLQTWADTVEFGAYPDTLVNFPVAEVDVFYSTDLNFKVPNEVTLQLDPTGTFVGSEISSFVVTSVEGVPEGMDFACNLANCEYEGGDNGCANIFGTPTIPGTYDIVINIKATILVALIPGFPPTPIDQDTEFTGYKIIVEEELNTNENELNTASVYPNPVNDILTIDNPLLTNYSVKIISSTGSIVKEEIISQQKQTIDVAKLPKGIYTVTLTNEDEIKHLKIIKH